MRLLVASSLISLLCACPGQCPGPQYEGKASDEAYLTMLDAESRATPDAAKAPVPQLADGTQLPASPIPTFRWSSSLTASLQRVPARRPELPERRWYEGLFISSAWAHLPPVTGPVFWLKFAVPGQECPVEVFSTRTDWTPTTMIWTQLQSGTGPRTITAQSAYLTENRITEGPFKLTAPVTFTVSPP